MKKPLNLIKNNLRLLSSMILVSLSVLTLMVGFNFIDDKFNQNSDINISLINTKLETNTTSVSSLIDYHKYDEFLIYEDNNKSEKVKDDENISEVQSREIENNINSKKVETKISKKPKLVIIIDDVSFSHQVNDIKRLKLNLTMSFLPPNSIHPSSVYLAKSIENYMVHLPLEALKYPKEEEHTLNVNDSEEKIETRIKQIREWFPKAKYINNHTGSRFTADKDAIRKLFKILEKYNFKFIDSKTTPESKVKVIANEFNTRYISRDVFLDNVANVEYIKIQLKKAVARAKQKGMAIAICHPRRDTIKALSESSEILKEIELLNINEI
jgi:uncharacterized protein